MSFSRTDSAEEILHSRGGIFRAADQLSFNHARYDALGNLAAEYTSSTGAPPCSICYFSWDHLGSTRMVTDQSGNVIANGRHDYLPYGYEIAGGTAGRTAGVWGEPDYLTAKFTSQERDTETGFDHVPARYMASLAGRFLSPDPENAGADFGNPQSWNGYSYARNNPMALVDPSGLCSVDVHGNYVQDQGNICPPPPNTTMSVNGDSGDISLWTTSIPSGACLSVYLDGVPQPNTCDEGQPVYTVAVTTPRMAPLSIEPGAPNNATPWYQNSCITSALAKGAASTALDAVGTFVPAGGAAEGAVAGAFSLWRGAAGVSQGRGVFQGVMLAGGIVNTASAGSEGNSVSAGLGALGVAATLGKAAPGVGQIISGISMGVDIVQTIQAVGKCQ